MGKGLSEEDATNIINTMAKYKDFFVDHMLVMELGLMPVSKMSVRFITSSFMWASFDGFVCEVIFEYVDCVATILYIYIYLMMLCYPGGRGWRHMEKRSHNFWSLSFVWVCSRVGLHYLQRTGERGHHIHNFNCRYTLYNFYAWNLSRCHYQAAFNLEVYAPPLYAFLIIII